eukprot:12179671-Alexandrium_andersonii.AAC.1
MGGEGPGGRCDARRAWWWVGPRSPGGPPERELEVDGLRHACGLPVGPCGPASPSGRGRARQLPMH